MSFSEWSRILLVSGNVIGAEHAKSLSHTSLTATWTGFIYDDQGVTDESRVAMLLQQLSDGKAIGEAAAPLRGAFFLVVRDNAANVAYSFVDDSGLFTAYRSSLGSATSFIQLCQASGIRAAAFSRSAIIQLFHLGNVYFGDTLAADIQKIASHEIVVSTPTSQHVIPKPIARLCDPPVHTSMENAIAPLAKALAGQAVSVDITGGFDSRLLACLLAFHGVPFECALSGLESNLDAALGKRVAEALRRPYHFSTCTGERALDDLEQTLERLDGMGGLILVNHRLRQLSQDRIKRGVTVSLKGSGGELYKDFFWTQDFPLYRSRHTRMDRLNRLRLEFELLTPAILTDGAYADYVSLREDRCRRLKAEYTMPFNTQSYDNVYFYERVQTWNSRMITSTQEARLAIHAPLCELRLAQLGFHAPRRMRFYNRFHRQVISRCCPAAAQLPTTDGTSASANSMDMLCDALGYVRGKSKKLAKKLSQVLFNKTRFVPPAYSPDLNSLRLITQSKIGLQALETMKQAGIIRPAVTYADVSPRFQEHLLSVGWTLQRLS